MAELLFFMHYYNELVAATLSTSARFNGLSVRHNWRRNLLWCRTLKWSVTLALVLALTLTT